MMILILFAAATAQPAAEKTPQAARAVVERYYAAIDRRRYATAYRLWVGSGRASGKTLRAFAGGFARTAHTHVVTGAPTDGEGAAGSVFVTIPVRVDAVLKNGTRQRFVGRYVLRRVNDVDGATAEQLRWHIASAVLRVVR
ncbi:hypothetical protein [Sphingomonas sp.]|uniref:hypothetical protein n=1 Tax=Sphingomonas sp. TaxID=28214 RepID=UPI0035BC718E